MFEFFYKRTHLLFATIAGLFIFGILGLIFMPKNLFPDSARPEIVVFTSMPGASANVIATSVSKPIEEEVAKLSHIYDIRSTNVPNFSIVHIIFDYTKTLNDSMLDVSNALNKIKSKLPPHTTSAIYLVGTFTQPVDLFSVSSDKMSLSEVRKIVDSFIKPKLLTNKEIGNVEIFGGYESAISITIDAKKLKMEGEKIKRRALLILRKDSKFDNKSIEELKELAEVLYEPVDVIVQIRKADPKYQIGSGLVERIAERIKEDNIDIVIVGNQLTPSQKYNLAKKFKVEVIDKIELVLRIFYKHARTKEAQLQVRLAELQYELPRAREKVRLAKMGEQPGFGGLWGL